MQATTALGRLGGIAESQVLLRLTSRRKIRRAVRSGEIMPLSRGRFALPTASAAQRVAGELRAVICLRSAAAHHGWEMKSQPTAPEVAVPRNRKLPRDRRQGVRVLWMDLGEDDRHAGATSPLRTVIDCARHLPFDEALAIADSALRSGTLRREDLDGVQVRGAGASAVRRVLQHADGRAANPFESVLRAHCIEAGLAVEPQVELDLETGVVHPDLVCRDHQGCCEIESRPAATARLPAVAHRGARTGVEPVETTLGPRGSRQARPPCAGVQQQVCSDRST